MFSEIRGRSVLIASVAIAATLAASRPVAAQQSPAAKRDSIAKAATMKANMPGMTMPAAKSSSKSGAKKAKTTKDATRKTATEKSKVTSRPAPAADHMMAPASHADSSMVMPKGTMKDMPSMPAMRDTTNAMPGMKDSVPTHAGMSNMTNSDTAHGKGSPVMTMFEPLGVPMDRMGSGTTWIPDAVSLPARHFMAGEWELMLHGFVFAEENVQGGSRGASQSGSLNWGMFMASRELAGGRFQARTMLSLDPATVTNRGYPLLLQSGEALGGQPLHDRQHPHDFLMELGVLYERPVASDLGLSLYAAPSGEPALGPVAFMHRPSAMDVPAAPIGHHWQDATHISFGVLTAGVFGHSWKAEGSLFNGREPDEHRWNIDPVTLDSYSGRLTINPTANWSLSGGYGYLKSPEALHPAESMHRVTASLLHGVKLGADGQWASTVVWGANTHGGADLTHSLLVESEAVLDRANTVFGRAEWVQKSAEDLVLDTPAAGFPADRLFNVSALSLGYIRDFARWSGATLGLGGMGTVNVVPSALEPAYGSRTPLGLQVFLRLRPVHSAEPGAMGGMQMGSAPATPMTVR